MAYEDLNLILVLAGLGISVSIPFIMRGFSKRDKSIEKIEEENAKRHEETIERLDKYEERLRQAELQIVRNGNALSRSNKNGG